MTIQENIEHDFATGSTDVYGRSMLFHCNHYNRSLQQYVEDPNYIDSADVFLRSAAETLYLQTREYFERNPDATFDDTLEFAADLFSFAGFGSLDLDELSEGGGTVVGEQSHYGQALKLNVGDRSEPGEYFDRGFVAGVLAAAGERFDLPYSDGFDIHQPDSIATGDDVCTFEVDTDGDYQWLELTNPDPRPDIPSAPPRDVDTAVDEEAVIEAVAGLDLTGNEEGLIPNFGLYLTRNYADYYNKTSFRFENAIIDEMGSTELATDMLTEAAHICGFNTFGGIMTSPEWEAAVMPMVESTEDWIHGMVAVINALGWGIWRVEELVPDERLVVRVYDCYESLGYRQWFGTADHPVEYLVKGGSTALMNLVYYGDIAARDGVDDELYYELFKDKGGFDSELTNSIAMGDDYVEAVVTR